MKIRYILIALVTLLVSCSSEMEKGEDMQNNLKGDSGYGYLSVNVIAPDADTRVGFSAGSSTETKITSLRFYFFDEAMKAKAINTAGNTYIDVSTGLSNDDVTEGSDQNIESTVKTILKLESLADNTWPSYIAVVANLGTGAPTLGIDDNVSSLQQITGAYTSQDPFVMSSAVYMADNKEQIAVSIEGKIKETEGEAEESVNLYVERVVAKVSGNINIETADGQTVSAETGTYGNESFNIYKLSSGKAKGETNEEDIYVRFLGWNVTATANKARLVKKINTGWDNVISGWKVSWNDAGNFRSYWAINPELGINDFTFGDFDSAKSFKFGTGVNNSSGDNLTYILENAGKAVDGNSVEIVTTKVIGAAQLVDQSGAPLTLVKWGGTIYNYGNTNEQNRVKGMWASNTRIYKQQTGTNTWESIKPADLELEATEPGSADNAFSGSGEPRYYSKLKLKDNGINKYAFYISGSGTDIVLDKGEDNLGYGANSPEIIAALEKIGLIEYWNSGHTYYWFDIPHLGGDVTSPDGTVSAGTGKYGVVRNNWINFTVTSVDGLGTPVANPGKVIYPEKTEDPDESYLGVQFEILPWRYVDQGSTVLGK